MVMLSSDCSCNEKTLSWVGKARLLNESEAHITASTPKSIKSMEVFQTAFKDFGSDLEAAFHPQFTMTLLQREQKAFLFPFSRCGDRGTEKADAEQVAAAWDRVTPAPHKRYSGVEGRHQTKLILFTKGSKGLHFFFSYRNTQKTIFSGRKLALSK